MANVNYVRECKALIAYASDNKITANEFVLWHALFNLVNLQATSNVWPDGFIPVSNSRLLSFTTFGCGDSAMETLRKTRDKLIQHGLIRYQAGQRNQKNPCYQLVYFCPEAKEVTQYKLGNPLGNMQGNPLGNMQGNPLGNMGDIYTNVNQGKTEPKNEKKLYYNDAWRTDARALKAVAQNILEAARYAGVSPIATETVCHYLEKGMTPEQALSALDGIEDYPLGNVGGWLKTAADKLGLPECDDERMYL